jgi:hypothetical protein
LEESALGDVCGLLNAQQESLTVQAAREAGQAAIGTDHAVARHDDAQRVPAVREADGLGGTGLPQFASQLSVLSPFYTSSARASLIFAGDVRSNQHDDELDPQRHREMLAAVVEIQRTGQSNR